MASYSAKFHLRGERGATKRFEAADMREAEGFARGWADAHWPCDVLSVSGPLPEAERDERADHRAERGCEEPERGGEEQLRPYVPAPGEDDEGVRDANPVLGTGPVNDEAGGDLLGQGIEHNLILLAGDPDEVKVKKLTKHAFLVHCTGEVRALKPLLHVTGFSRVLPDPEEVREQVGGDGVHIGAPNDWRKGGERHVAEHTRGEGAGDE